MISSIQERQSGEFVQLILGTDKRNPAISVYEAPDSLTLHVYYGLELMEVIEGDKESAGYKLLVGRLYNAGVKVRTLQETFAVDRKTMKRWGDALLEGDPEKLIEVLTGRHRGKITREIEGFVRMRFKSVYTNHRSSYSAFLRREIKEVFGVGLSGEALRPLLGQLRASFDAGSAATTQPEAEPKRETACDDGAPHSPAAPAGMEGMESACQAVPPAVPARKPSPVFEAMEVGTSRFCHHAGVLLFAHPIAALRKAFDEPACPLLPQWLACVLLGALNIEQSKFLDFEDLEFLLGHTVPSLHPQREGLRALGLEKTTEKLLAFNAAECPAAQGSDFYYDPHTKAYSGAANILKGWCGSTHRADKALHTDFIHGADGTPLFMEWSDNFHDLRERFPENIKEFRKVARIDPKKAITITLDRGIYGLDFFQWVLAEEHLHIVTWEKGYEPSPWPTDVPVATFALERSRNRAADVRSYRFEFIARPWKKDARMKQILVRATHPSGRTAEVSILADDLQRPEPEIIRAIFWRWLQENDFKYLDKHFGINQITGYAVIAYEALGGKIRDKQMKNGEHQALSRERSELKRDLGRILVARRQREGQELKLEELQKEPLRASALKSPAKEEARVAKIEARIKVVDELQNQTRREVSRLETLIGTGKEKLNTANKSVMDSVKIIARNAFYRALAPFKKAYDNYRDDHEYFRRLTRAHGIIVARAGELEVHLITPVHFPEKIRQIVIRHLDEINRTTPCLPDGSGRALRFFLGDKQGIQLAPQNPPKS